MSSPLKGQVTPTAIILIECVVCLILSAAFHNWAAVGGFVIAIKGWAIVLNHDIKAARGPKP